MERVLEQTKAYCLRNIAPPVGTMLVFILGAFLIYKGFYTGPSAAAAYAGLTPAAGTEIIRDNGHAYIPVDIDHIPVWSAGSQ